MMRHGVFPRLLCRHRHASAPHGAKAAESGSGCLGDTCLVPSWSRLNRMGGEQACSLLVFRS